MSGVATAAVVGGYMASESNKDAAETAANARPQFASIVEPSIRRQLNRLRDSNIETFSGDRVAPFSNMQQLALGSAQGLAGDLQAQQDVVGQGFNQFASGSMIGQNPFLEDAIMGMRESAFRDLSRNQLPAIRNNAIQTGGVGGTRQGVAEGVAISDLNRDLLNREGGLRAQQVNQDMSNMLTALTNQGNILSGQLNPYNLLQQAGGMEQIQNQALIDAEMAQFNEEQNAQWNRDQQLLSILMGTPASVPPIPMQQDPLATGLGTAMLVSQLRGQQQPSTVVNTGGTGATNTNNPSSSFYSNPFFYG